MSPLHNIYSRLTDEQFEAIGRVTANSAVVEYALELILGRLALAPGFLALALTNSLNIDNRLEALKNLTFTHSTRYGGQFLPSDLLLELSALAKDIAKIKDRRNKIVHYVWFRSTDTMMYGHKFKGRQHGDNPQTLAARAKARIESPDEMEDGTDLVYSVVKLKAFADKIDALSVRMFALLARLPDIDEGWLVRSVKRGSDRRRSGARSKRPGPHRS
jgi:hypothetical protein